MPEYDLLELDSQIKKADLDKLVVSILVPIYNEESILKQNLSIICSYMKTIEDEYAWELIIVNDGSKDRSGAIGEEFSKGHKNVKIVHHKTNLYLGCALRTGIKECSGEYIVVLDCDLSYSPDHIERLLDTIIKTDSDIVIASPYMKGGEVSSVPFFRELMSRCINLFLSFIVREGIHTFTGMVRAYRREFIQNINLKARDFEVNSEIIYKSLLLRGRILEIPAHLDWSLQNEKGGSRVSGLRLLRGITSGLMTGFIFKPYFYFLLSGFLTGLISFYIIIWIFINTLAVYPEIPQTDGIFDDRLSTAIGVVFKERPHAFVVGGITLVTALQLLSLGFLSLQNKRYFEEVFHIDTTILKSIHNDDYKQKYMEKGVHK